MKMGLALENVRRVLLDTAPAIYFLERHPVHFPRMEAFFRIRRERGIVIATSPITLAECLVHPIRRGMSDLADGYKRLILGGVGTEFHDIGPEVAEHAARLRASHSIALMDALQVGVAVAAGCQALLTNDRRMASISAISILLLDDLEA